MANTLSNIGGYTRTYSDIRGVDFTGDRSEPDNRHCAYLENLWRDYDGENANALESVPGTRRVCKFTKPIHGIFSQKDDTGEDFLLVHVGTKLYRFRIADRDTITSLSPIATLASSESRAFSVGSDLFILDGTNIVRVNGSGVAGTVGVDIDPYVPTLFYNGEEYEQRNLLTDAFREVFTVTDAQERQVGSDCLTYTVTDADELLCEVSGCTADESVWIYVPPYVDIDGVRHRVVGIGNGAFQQNTHVTACTVAEGVEYLGDEAFLSCLYLREVYLPDSLRTIGSSALASLPLLTTLHLGKGLTQISADALTDDNSLTAVCTSGDAAQLAALDHPEALGGRSMEYGVPPVPCHIFMPIISPALTVAHVFRDGVAAAFDVVEENNVPIGITLDIPPASTEATVTVDGTLQTYAYASSRTHTNFLGEAALKSVAPASVIRHCRLAESFDGRIFLAGNPDFPSAVFYSSRNLDGKNDPLYFGVLNYFNDGGGNFRTTSLLAAGDRLAVFKEADGGGGSIFYHSAADTGEDLIPRVYPVTYTHAGLPAVGESISFYDDPVFLSPLGLSSLEKEQINLERSVTVRSHRVNPRLLAEDLTTAKLAKWCGYLVLLVGGHIYLADSRATFRHPTGSVEYEWFYLTNIGAYQNARTIYRYAERGANGFQLHEKIGQRVITTVYSFSTPEGYVYYTVEGGVAYAVEQTDESDGGTFRPANVMHAVGDLLFLGTENGVLMTFNNDKRGVPPKRIADAADFDPAEYAAVMGKRIHEDFYSFDSHAVRYALATPRDTCGFPHLTKSTVPRSLVVRCSACVGGQLVCEVGTDNGGYREVADYPGGILSFDDVNFADFSLSTDRTVLLPIAEKEKNWAEKQIVLYSERFRSPIAVSRISYRYTVRGRIKNP